MTTKHHVTTDVKVVKQRNDKQEKRPPSPPPPQKEAESNIVTYSEEEVQKLVQKLRHFDLDWRYGPCTGISRLQRWERAQLHRLNPPEEIRELLVHSTDSQFTQSLWSGYSL